MKHKYRNYKYKRVLMTIQNLAISSPNRRGVKKCAMKAEMATSSLLIYCFSFVLITWLMAVLPRLCCRKQNNLNNIYFSKKISPNYCDLQYPSLSLPHPASHCCSFIQPPTQPLLSSRQTINSKKKKKKTNKASIGVVSFSSSSSL